MPAASPTTEPTTVGVQRRTVRVLVATQVVGGVGFPIAITIGGPLGERLSGSTELSGLVGTFGVLGAALLAVPLARLAAAHGRRLGLVVGWTAGAAGALLILLAAVVESFAVLLLGALLFGGGNAAGLLSRFAATDLATSATRGRALSLVVWATTVGAVLGPNLSDPGAALGDRLGLPREAAPVLFSVASFAAAAVLVGVLLRPDPLLTARRLRGDVGPRPAHPRVRASLAVVRRSPRAVLALLAVVLSHAVMVGIMTMTPVHMSHHDAGLRVVGLVISVHIAGMFAFSPVMGWLADRWGRVPVILAGQALLVVAAAVSGLGGSSSLALGVGLFLLGLGWSCALVAGSTLLTESVPLEDRPGVQGASDFTMNLVGAAAGAASGGVLGWLGYGGLATLAALLTLPVVVVLVVVSRRPASVAPA